MLPLVMALVMVLSLAPTSYAAGDTPEQMPEAVSAEVVSAEEQAVEAAAVPEIPAAAN